MITKQVVGKPQLDVEVRPLMQPVPAAEHVRIDQRFLEKSRAHGRPEFAAVQLAGPVPQLAEVMLISQRRISPGPFTEIGLWPGGYPAVNRVRIPQLVKAVTRVTGEKLISP